MSHVKDKYYWDQLRAALAAGNWDAPFPARAPNGSFLSWSELLRKFNKHCIGYEDVAELASQTHALSLMLCSLPDDRPSEFPLTLAEECVLPQERVEETSIGYAKLQGLREAHKDPVKLALAYYAYALGRPSECLHILDEIPNLTDVSSRVSAYTSMSPDNAAPSTHNGATDASPLRKADALPGLTMKPPLDTTEARMWGVTECVRSVALQGMSHERTNPNKPAGAIRAYSSAIPLINAVLGELQTSANNTAAQSATFTRYNELWRWCERLLRRAIILSACSCDVSQQDESNEPLWSLLGLYRACSIHWPSTFRPQLRSTIATIHVRAYVLRANNVAQDILKTKAPRWISSARSVLQELRTLLNACTHFPRAGERNEQVEDFVDLCVAVWEADGAVGEYAGWVIDLLWWATRLTFNSFRIYRHMSWLCSASGDPALARRLLQLYVQVVSKAREAATSEGASTDGASADNEEEFDSNYQWVKTLVQGCHLLCKQAVQEVDHGKAHELAVEAGDVLQKARTRLDNQDMELVASVHLAEGTWHSVVAYTEQDPRTRGSRLAQSLESFNAAIAVFPSAAAHHQLSLALARSGPTKNLDEAVEHARAAVELDSNESRHWHLLGLLLATAGDWKAARGVLEIGIGLAETDLVESDDHDHAELNTTFSDANGISIRDFAQAVDDPDVTRPPEANGHEEADAASSNKGPLTVVPPDCSAVPSSSTLLRPLGDRPRPTRQERFEFALQMRMTQLALTEFVEGVEGVGDRWLEVFQWFRGKRPATLDDRRKSIDSRRVSQDTRPSDMISVRTQQPRRSADTSRLELPNNTFDSASSPTPIPITVTPATPGLQGSESQIGSQSSYEVSNEKRSSSLDEKDRDVSRGKKVKEVLKSGVHKGQARITTISKKIGHGVGRHGSLNLKRTNSAPDFHSILSHTPYQASSIHLRQYHSIHASQQDLGFLDVPPPPRAASPDPSAKNPTHSRPSKDSRLLSDLWLMSAAIFRRQGKIEQAKGAIQEAEVRDEDNPNVWVQLGLYYSALSDDYQASEAFRKALFIEPNHVAATVYLCRLYLEPTSRTSEEAAPEDTDEQNVDLAAGLLSDLTRGRGWDVPEAWYFLAKAYKLQDRRDRERECLNFALVLSETRGVRDITSAVGWCL